MKKLAEQYRLGAYHRIAPTHFGIFDDPAWHLQALAELLDETEAWILKQMPSDPTIEELNASFLNWTEERSQRDHLTQPEVQIFEAANPSWMSAAGIHRYWHKTRVRS